MILMSNVILVHAYNEAIQQKSIAQQNADIKWCEKNCSLTSGTRQL